MFIAADLIIYLLNNKIFTSSSVVISGLIVLDIKPQIKRTR